MNVLTSMLIPLMGSLPGWPQAEQPSALSLLFIIVILPVAAGVLLLVLSMAGSLVRKGRSGPSRVSEPVWLGRTTDRKHISQGSRAELGSGETEAKETGGASVRW